MLQLALSSLKRACSAANEESCVSADGDKHEGNPRSAHLKGKVLRILHTLADKYPPLSLTGLRHAVPPSVRRSVQSICKVLLELLDLDHAEDIFDMFLASVGTW